MPAEDHDDDQLDEINEDYLSECCEAPILGQPITTDLGLCSRCREWSGIKPNRES